MKRDINIAEASNWNNIKKGKIEKKKLTSFSSSSSPA